MNTVDLCLFLFPIYFFIYLRQWDCPSALELHKAVYWVPCSTPSSHLTCKGVPVEKSKQQNDITQQICRWLNWCLLSCLSIFFIPLLHWKCTYCISESEDNDRKSLSWVINSAERIIGLPLPPLDDIFRTRSLHRAGWDSPRHLFSLLPSGRRYQATTARTSRLQNSPQDHHTTK